MATNGQALALPDRGADLAAADTVKEAGKAPGSAQESEQTPSAPALKAEDPVDATLENGAGAGGSTGEDGSAADATANGGAKEESKEQDGAVTAVDTAEADVAMEDATIKPSSVAGSESGTPGPREATPALSEAASDATSAAVSTPGENGGPASTAMASEPSTNAYDLAFPLSAYQFANTTLVPIASTSTRPFDFQNFPYQTLEESWSRSKRSDDPEAYELPDTEYFFFATKDELETSRVREEERKAKVQERLIDLGLVKGKAREVEPVAQTPTPPSPPLSRAASRSRAMEKVASASGAPNPTAPRRGRPPKSSLQQQIKPQKQREVSVESRDPTPPPAKPKKAPAKTVARPTTRFDRSLVQGLLPNDAQTATPTNLEPHPAFIDLFELPPYYLPDGELAPAAAKPATQPAAANPHTSAKPASANEASPAAAPAVDIAGGSSAVPAASTSRAPRAKRPTADAPAEAEAAQSIPALAAPASAAPERVTPAVEAAGTRSRALPVIAPVTAEEEQPASPMDVESQSSTTSSTKRARPADDEGKKAGRKKARESSTSGTATPGGGEEAPLGPPVNWVMQSTTCLSKKVDGQVRCFQCIARGVGHGCSFIGLRSFGVDYLNRIVTPPVFRSTTYADDVPDFNKTLTKPMNWHDTELMKTWLAQHLEPIFQRELKQASQPNTRRVRHDLSTHALCDTCNTAQIGSQWMCTTCGRVACRVCVETLEKIEAAEAKGDQVSSADAQRRRKCIAKRRGKDTSGGENHKSSMFIPLNSLNPEELKAAGKKASKWHATRMLAATDAKTYKYLRRKFCTPSSLKDYDLNTHPVNTVDLKDLTEPIYFELWRMGEPIIVKRVPRGGMSKFTPEWLAERTSSQKVDLINNYGTEILPSTGAYFFGQFWKPGFRRADEGKSSFRAKDFPSGKQFAAELKEMEEEFLKMIPLPNILRPDGIYNMLGHTPVNALQPDLGPRPTSSWETNAKWGTTQLRTDCTDVASYMYWGGRDKQTGKPLRIRWDVFRAEDTDKLRDFCWELIIRKLPKGRAPLTPAAEKAKADQYRAEHDDPLLSPQLYLTKSQRLELFQKYGVKPFPLYQFEGDLVLIPAGCPYQVSSWIDHLNLTMSYLSGARIGEALKVNQSLQHQTKERSVWRQDHIQLESQLLWAWRACEAFEKATPMSKEEEDKVKAKEKKAKDLHDEEQKEKKREAEAQERARSNRLVANDPPVDGGAKTAPFAGSASTAAPPTPSTSAAGTPSNGAPAAAAPASVPSATAAHQAIAASGPVAGPPTAPPAPALTPPNGVTAASSAPLTSATHAAPATTAAPASAPAPTAMEDVKPTS
ncbi:hypothetical protein JCM10207_005260 [Rhodosporidiobolus poonsookiae]